MYPLGVRCSWVHCGSVFEGTPSEARQAGWGLVCRQTVTGELVVVCPDHLQELLGADLRALESLFKDGVPSLVSPEDRYEPTRRLGRPSK